MGKWMAGCILALACLSMSTTAVVRAEENPPVVKQPDALTLTTPVRPAPAPWTPPFDADTAAWYSTDIIVVSAGKRDDGTVTVLDVWEGQFAPGAVITIPELAEFEKPEKRAINPKWRTGKVPSEVSNDRIVLFFYRSADSGDKTEAKPAFHVTTGSIAWIVNGEACAFQQAERMGPIELRPLGCTEAKIKAEVSEALAARKALRDIAVIADPEEKAGKAATYVNSRSFGARVQAITVLGDCGPAGLPALRAIIHDESKTTHQWLAIDALAKAGGQSVGPELTEIVETELAFWKDIAPKLKPGWWDGAGLEPGQVQPLRDRFYRVRDAVDSLGKIHFTPCRAIIMEFRDFWRSVPPETVQSGQPVNVQTGAAGVRFKTPLTEDYLIRNCCNPTLYALVPQDPFGKEAGGLQVSLNLRRARISNNEPLVADVQVTNVLPAIGPQACDIYVLCSIDYREGVFEFRVVNERGEDKFLISAPCGESRVLRLSPSQFFGYRVVLPQELRDMEKLPAGRYTLYAIFKNALETVPGPAFNLSQEQVERMTPEERKKLGDGMRREFERIQKEQDKLGDNSLWIGQAYSEKVNLEILPAGQPASAP